MAATALAKRREGEVKAMMSAAWHGAAWERSKRMPALNRVIGDTERPAKSGKEIIDALKAKFGKAANG